MVGCAAVGCTNSSQKGSKMFSFPRDVVRRQIWSELTNRGGGWVPNNYSVLCQDHFNDEDFDIKTGGVIRLKNGAVPTHFEIVSGTSHRKIPKFPERPRQMTTSIKILKPEELNAMQKIGRHQNNLRDSIIEMRKSQKRLTLKRSSDVKTYSQSIRPNSDLIFNKTLIKKEVPPLKIVDQEKPDEYIQTLVTTIVDLQGKLEHTEALNRQMNLDLAQYVKVAEELSRSEAFYREKYKNLRAKVKLENYSDNSDNDN